MKLVRSGIFLLLLIATAKAAPTLVADVVEFDEDDLRLPQTSIPISYDLTLTTQVHDAGARALSGFVRIEIQITETTDFIALHNRGLTIVTVKLINAAETELEIVLDTNSEREFLIIESQVVPLETGALYTIEIEYTGSLQTGTLGFYRSSYKVGAETRYVFLISFIAKYFSLGISYDKDTWLQHNSSQPTLVTHFLATMSQSSRQSLG